MVLDEEADEEEEEAEAEEEEANDKILVIGDMIKDNSSNKKCSYCKLEVQIE